MSLNAAPGSHELKDDLSLTGKRKVQAILREELRRWRCAEGRKEVDRGLLEGTDGLRDTADVLVAEVDSEAGQPPVLRRAILKDRGRRNPQATCLRPLCSTGAKLLKVARSLTGVNESLAGVRA